MKCPLILALLLAGPAAAQTTLSGFPSDILCYAHNKSLHEGERVTMGAELKQRKHVCTEEDITKGHESYIKWRQALTEQIFRDAAGKAFGPTPPPGKTCTTQHIDGQPPQTTCR